MQPGRSVSERLKEQIRQVTLLPDVNEDDELYYDLKLSGVDLLEVVAWVANEFDVDCSRMNINQFAPGEGAEFFRSAMEWLGMRPYKSLRVRDLLHAIEHRQWPPPAA
jgi:acyl carrier protein